MMQHKISFAGAGRVAWALCSEMYRAGFSIELIVSRNEKNGRSLADSCEALWSPDLIFQGSSEIIIVAVPDSMLKNVLNKMRCGPDTLVAHTAGSLGIDVFPENIKRKGIFYPLQTFSKERKVVFKDLPFLLETSDKHSSVILKNLAESIGGKVHFVKNENRRILHLSAVFVCNFTNHMLTIGKELVLKADFPFDVLSPLIKETFLKAMDLGPENSQTGPAFRNDQNTIEKHMDLLSFSSELQRIYSEMTRSIIKYYSKDKR